MCSSGFNSLCTWDLMSRWVKSGPGEVGPLSGAGRKIRSVPSSSEHRRYRGNLTFTNEPTLRCSCSFYWSVADFASKSVERSVLVPLASLQAAPSMFELNSAVEASSAPSVRSLHHVCRHWQRCLSWICVLHKCKLSGLWGIVVVDCICVVSMLLACFSVGSR